MWELYDELIKNLPQDIYPTRFFQSGHCTILEFDKIVGATVTNSQSVSKPIIKGYNESNNSFSLANKNEYLKLSWYELGSLIKSWNFKEASIGAAAINAFYNQMNMINTSVSNNEFEFSHIIDPFDELADISRNKIITTIGHFGTLKPCFKNASETRIIEMNLKKGDYPESSCEYLIPNSDIVIITGFTFINKTLPRLLELAKGSYVMFVGPSCPISNILFNYGVDDIASSVFDNFDDIKERAKIKTHKILVKVGKEVRLIKNRKEN